MTIDLKAWRNAQGITQALAADRLCLTLRYYQKLEAGHCPIGPRVAKLAAMIAARLESETID